MHITEFVDISSDEGKHIYLVDIIDAYEENIVAYTMLLSTDDSDEANTRVEEYINNISTNGSIDRIFDDAPEFLTIQ